MHFYFIRHGQSENNHLWAQSNSYDDRVADPALTAVGERQAELLARLLAAPGIADASRDATVQDVEGFHITHVYCSLMDRAVATGHKVAEALDLPLLGWIDIHETGGMFLYDEETDTHTPQPGHSRSYLLAHYPRLVLPDEATEAGWWNRPFEVKDARPPRARRVREALLARHGGSDDGVAFVSHGGFFNYLLRAFLGLSDLEPEDAPNRLWFSANNASITHIAFDGERRAVMYMNRVDFLPRDLIT
jgi:2,3-bisphosphoglycerate-dependent phosphoglycerate mutase